MGKRDARRWEKRRAGGGKLELELGESGLSLAIAPYIYIV
jgi:hypothetical protein